MNYHLESLAQVLRVTCKIEFVSELIGVDQSRIRQMQREGRLPSAERRGQHPLAPIVRDYIKILKTGGADGEGEDSKAAYFREQARLTAAKADNEEMRRDLQRGVLVDAEDLTGEVRDYIYACKAKLLSLPSKLAGALAPVTDPREIEQIIEAAVVEALEELSRGEG